MMNAHHADAQSHPDAFAPPGPASSSTSPWGTAVSTGTIHVGSSAVPTMEWAPQAPINTHQHRHQLLQQQHHQAAQQLTQLDLVGTQHAEPWRLAPAAAVPVAAAVPLVERQVLLRPIGRRDGLLGLLGGLVLLGLPIVGAIALGNWQPAPKPAAAAPQVLTSTATAVPVAPAADPTAVAPAVGAFAPADVIDPASRPIARNKHWNRG